MKAAELVELLGKLPHDADIHGEEMFVDLGELECGCNPHPWSESFDALILCAIECMTPCDIADDSSGVACDFIDDACETCGHERACKARAKC